MTWRDLLDILAEPRTRRIVSWFLLAAALLLRGAQAWLNFRDPNRPTGNSGHTSIDFGGQWMMGRLLVLGYGPELYSRPRHLEIARQAYPRDQEPPGAVQHDAETLVAWYIGEPDEPIGGPLYPPVHAFVMAPFALISDPYLAYRIVQLFQLGCVLSAGWALRYWSGGAWWWPAATAFLLMFPGCRGGIDLGQNSPFSGMLVLWGWALIVRGRPVCGGAVWGILAFKPVWAITFLAALILLARWRSALAMAATGAALALATLPVVGIAAWFDWLHVGRLAADHYLIDRNWIFLSRDLFGIPRRVLLDFDNGLAVRDRPLAGILGWLLWGLVAGASATLAWRRAARFPPPERLAAPFASMILLAAWLCCYRFLYYDAYLAAAGVVVALGNPTAFLRKAWWPFRGWPAHLTVVLFGLENIASALNIEFTGQINGLRHSVPAPDGTTEWFVPQFFFATGDDYPWTTLVILALWLWCVVQVLRGRAVQRAPA